MLFSILTVGCEAPRRAFTLLEITIAILILTVGLLAALSTTGSMHLDSEGLRQEEQAHFIGRALCERIQTAEWSGFGNKPLYLQRRMTPARDENKPPLNPPLTAQDLVNMGCVGNHPALPGLEVYVEYYRMAMIDRMNELTGVKAMKPKDAWYSLVGNPFTIPPKPPNDGSKPEYWQVFYEPGATKTFLPDERLRPDSVLEPDPDLTVVPQRFDDGMLVRVVVAWVPAGTSAAPSTSSSRIFIEMLVGVRKP